MKMAPGLAADIRRSSTWKARSMFWRSVVSASPIETQVSVTTSRRRRRPDRVGDDAHLGARAPAPSPPRPCAAQDLRAGDVELEPEHRGGVDPGGRHVVAVARPGDALAPDRAAMLLKVMTSAISWHGWVRSVRPLMTGAAENSASSVQLRFLGGAQHDAVDIARQHPRGVRHRLAAAELRPSRSSTTVSPPSRSCRARTKRGCGSTVSRRSSPATCRRAAWTWRTDGCRLQRARDVDDLAQVVLGEPVEIEEVP